jgi:hypothetical protein
MMCYVVTCQNNTFLSACGLLAAACVLCDNES